MAKLDLRLDELRIEGASRAGDSTWFRVHPPGLAFDVGRGSLELTGAEHLFLSHGHLDHALGVPFVLSNRAMQGLGPAQVFCPSSTAPAVSRFLSCAETLEEESYEWEVEGLVAGDRVGVGRDLWVEAFAVEHVVPALGYHLIRGRRKLSPKYRGHSGEELAELRRAGVEIEELQEELWVTFCGDTSAAVFELEPRLFESRVLLIECTFLDDEDEAGAKRFGHLHFHDLLRHADRFRNEAIVLHHLTRRNQVEELRRAVDGRLPKLAERIHLVP